jgi:radical SAM protein with 4Fe4S-binding SPASM domain
MTFEGFPFIIGLELTLECNICCKHCASSAGKKRTGELSLNEIIGICRQFPQLMVQEVDITGGEPFMRADWYEVARYLKDLDIQVRMVSNGLLLRENIPRIKDAGIDTIGISLDGLEATHDLIRSCPGLFRKLFDGISQAIKAGIPVSVITSVNELNLSELNEMQKLIEGVGVKNWQVQPTFLMGRARTGNLGLSFQSFLRMGEYIQEQISLCGNSCFEIMPADGVGYYSKLDSYEFPWEGCGAGISSCGITSDGKVKGCLSMPNSMVEGDLRERDLWSIWFDQDSFRYNRTFTTADLGTNCTNCEYGERCKGGCAIMSYSATNQLHNDPYCFHRLKGAGMVTPT